MENIILQITLQNLIDIFKAAYYGNIVLPNELFMYVFHTNNNRKIYVLHKQKDCPNDNLESCTIESYPKLENRIYIIIVDNNNVRFANAPKQFSNMLALNKMSLLGII